MGSSPVHLVVLCHGLWGEPKHLEVLAMMLARSYGSLASISDGVEGRAKGEQSKDGGNGAASIKSGVSGNSLQGTLTQEQLETILDEYLTTRERKSTGTGVAELEEEIVILNSQTNKGSHTYDGIDWLGERTVQEIYSEEKWLKSQDKHVAKLSIIGYSLGGLVARYVVALLDAKGFFDKVQPRHFASFASPHCGVPPANGSFGRLANFIGGRLLSRTGEQLYLLDSGWESTKDIEEHKAAQHGAKKRDKKRPKVGLIEAMSRPDSSFYRALAKFKRITLYANAVNDLTVPFRSGCLEEWDPFLEYKEAVQVSQLDDAPLLTNVALADTKVDERSMWARLAAWRPSLPFFLNPRRLPFRFPFNYIIVIALPITLPTFLLLLIFRFAREAGKSRKRILELDSGWRDEDEDERAGTGRIDRLVRNVVMSVGEDRVDEQRGIFGSGDDADEEAVRRITVPTTNGNQSRVDSTATATANTADWTGLKKSPLEKPTAIEEGRKSKQPALHEAQKRIVLNLNSLPRLEKRWAYFNDVINSHAVIICRTPAMELHRKGLPILRHFVSDFDM